jgi:hypothetical protein
VALGVGLNIDERRQFYFAASGLDEFDFPGEEAEVEALKVKKSVEVLDKLMALLDQLRFPAYIQDVFGENVAGNSLAIKLYNITPEIIKEAANIPGGFTSVRLMFGNIISAVVTSGYDKYLLNSVRALREMSLRFRPHPYFRYLMKEFRDPKKYPGFERYWRHSALLEDDKDLNVDLFEYSHIVYGDLKYATPGLIPNTPHGELLLIYNIPLDKHTSDVFEQMASTEGTKAYRFAPWPEKKMD